MAELKPVPSGYDSSALSSMLGYLANARKSHDNNPFMRTILDQQARDNKAEYLADADLTRNAQADDNEYARMLNIAQLRQKDASERASRGSSMFTATGGAVQTDPLTADQNMNAQDPENMDAILNSLGLDKMLQSIKTQGEIGKIDAETENTQLGSVIHRMEAGDDRDIADITRQPKDVNVDSNNSLRRRVSSAQGENAVVWTNTQEVGQEALGTVLQYRDPNDGEIKEKTLTDAETRRYSGTPEGKKELEAMGGSLKSYKGRTTATDQTRTTGNSNGGQASPPKTRYISDEDQVRAFLTTNGIAAQEIGRDSEGIFAIVIEDGVKKTKRFK